MNIPDNPRRLSADWKGVDDLARIIMSPESFDSRPASCGPNDVYAARTAAAILAAGWRPPTPPVHAIEPRTPTTVDDLDALPRLTVIRDAEGVVFEKHTMWHEAGSRDLKYSPAIALPATVLQLGWGEE